MSAPSDLPPSNAPDDEPVPKLPRGRGLTLDKAMMMRIVGTLALLVMIVVTARPCGEATSRFVNGFDEQKGSNTEVLPKPGNVDEPPKEQHYEKLRPGMTDEEVKAAIDRAKAAERGLPAPAAVPTDAGLDAASDAPGDAAP